jgi:glyoxylate reductase
MIGLPPSLPKVLVTVKVPAEHLSPLDGLAKIVMPDCGVAACPREMALSLISECEAVLSQGDLRVDAELLDAAPRLRMVANAAMGIDNLDLAELARRGISAANTPDAFALSTADHTMGLLLSLTRRITEGDRYVRQGNWARDGRQPLRWEGRLASALTLGLVGYGRIAQLVESRAQAFGMSVHHTRATASDHLAFRSLDELLATSDVVVVLVPLSYSTRGMIGAAQLARMKPGAVLINVARGPVVDEVALVEALASGHLGGAALDVFAEEPEVPEALFQFPNVVLTPHTGGATREERRRGRLEAAAEVARFLRGEALLNPC